MNAELVTATAIVYSDLVSRSAALNVLNIGTEPWPRTDPDVVRFFDALRRGSLVARAYPTDLTAARTLAATSPPIMRARPDSRAAAALAIHSALIKVANGCGAADGAPVLRRLAPIAWKRRHLRRPPPRRLRRGPGLPRRLRGRQRLDRRTRRLLTSSTTADPATRRVGRSLDRPAPSPRALLHLTDHRRS